MFTRREKQRYVEVLIFPKWTTELISDKPGSKYSKALFPFLSCSSKRRYNLYSTVGDQTYMHNRTPSGVFQGPKK